LRRVIASVMVWDPGRKSFERCDLSIDELLDKQFMQVGAPGVILDCKCFYVDHLLGVEWILNHFTKSTSPLRISNVCCRCLDGETYGFTTPSAQRTAVLPIVH
jgi:hypothetical protein